MEVMKIDLTSENVLDFVSCPWCGFHFDEGFEIIVIKWYQGIREFAFHPACARELGDKIAEVAGPKIESDLWRERIAKEIAGKYT